MLRAELADPVGLITSTEMRLGLLGKGAEVGDVPVAHGLALPRFEQALERVLANGLEIAITRLAATPMLDHDQRLVDQPRERVEDFELVLGHPAYRGRGLERPAARKYRE